MSNTLAYPYMIGWDGLFEKANKWIESNSGSYPPYNIVKADFEENVLWYEEENKEFWYDYLIEVATAGFFDKELKVTLDENILTISGRKWSLSGDKYGSENYIHKGIASRDFEKKFTLADNVVLNSVWYVDGILEIRLLESKKEEKDPIEVKINSPRTVEEEKKQARRASRSKPKQ